MADKRQLEILQQGVEAWNVWRESHPETRPDLSGAKLSGADLSRANLVKANLIRADFSGAKLEGALLGGAVLCGGNFDGANLVDANFVDANLSRANLSNAQVARANFSQANLTGAIVDSVDLSAAVMGPASSSAAESEQTPSEPTRPPASQPPSPLQSIEIPAQQGVAPPKSETSGGVASATLTPASVAPASDSQEAAPRPDFQPAAAGASYHWAAVVLVAVAAVLYWDPPNRTAPAAPATATVSLETAEHSVASPPTPSIGEEAPRQPVAELASALPDRKEVVGTSITEVEEELSRKLVGQWGVRSVNSEGGVMTALVGSEPVGVNDYISIMNAACGTLYEMGGAPAELKEVRVLDSLETRGWVYTSPRKCGEVSRASELLARLLIAANSTSHPNRRRGQ